MAKPIQLPSSQPSAEKSSSPVHLLTRKMKPSKGKKRGLEAARDDGGGSGEGGTEETHGAETKTPNVATRASKATKIAPPELVEDTDSNRAEVATSATISTSENRSAGRLDQPSSLVLALGTVQQSDDPSGPGRGKIISVSNPRFIPGTGDTKPNPFFETMPGPRTWHKHTPPFFPFGETPFVQRALSHQISADLAEGLKKQRAELPLSSTVPHNKTASGSTQKRSRPDTRDGRVQKVRPEKWALPDPAVAKGPNQTEQTRVDNASAQQSTLVVV